MLVSSEETDKAFSKQMFKMETENQQSTKVHQEQCFPKCMLTQRGMMGYPNFKKQNFSLTLP